MNDPKMQDAPILRYTGCRVGNHVWTWTGGLGPDPPPSARCQCGLYSWDKYPAPVAR